MDDLEKFGSLEVLNSSPFERYNVQFKSDYRAISRKRRRTLEQTVKMINNSHIRKMTGFKRTWNGLSQSIVGMWDRIVQNGPFLFEME